MTEIEKYDDLIKQVSECLSIYRQGIQEQYVESLWQSGSIIQNHPLKDKPETIKILSDATGMSPRYFYYSVKIYNEFPFATFDEAVIEMMKRTERTVITERSLIALVEGRKEKEIKPRTFKMKFKDAVDLDLKTLIEYLKDEKVKFVKFYYDNGDGDYTTQIFKKI